MANSKDPRKGLTVGDSVTYYTKKGTLDLPIVAIPDSVVDMDYPLTLDADQYHYICDYTTTGEEGKWSATTPAAPAETSEPSNTGA